jgi:predicted DNA-binding transcriptional regulator AlpA
MDRSTRGGSAPGFDGLSDNALIRLDNLHSLRLVPFSSSTVWRKVRKGDFPAPIKISAGVTAWRVGDIREWLEDPAAFGATDQMDGSTK